MKNPSILKLKNNYIELHDLDQNMRTWITSEDKLFYSKFVINFKVLLILHQIVLVFKNLERKISGKQIKQYSY